MLANVSVMKQTQNTFKSALVKNMFGFMFGQGSESAAVICSADGSAEAFEPACTSYTTVDVICVNM